MRRLPGALITFFVLALVFAIAQPRETPLRPHPCVVLVTVDCLTPDCLGAYGRADAGTPVIDHLAAEGTRFTDVHAQSDFTTASTLSLLFSQWFTQMVLLRPRSPGPSLASAFQGQGYSTAAFIGTAVLFDPRVSEGFAVYRSAALESGGVWSAQRTTDEALRWVQAQRRDHP